MNREIDDRVDKSVAGSDKYLSECESNHTDLSFCSSEIDPSGYATLCYLVYLSGNQTPESIFFQKPRTAAFVSDSAYIESFDGYQRNFKRLSDTSAAFEQTYVNVRQNGIEIRNLSACLGDNFNGILKLCLTFNCTSGHSFRLCENTTATIRSKNRSILYKVCGIA